MTITNNFNLCFAPSSSLSFKENFKDFPDEISKLFFSFLAIKDQCHLSLVNKDIQNKTLGQNPEHFLKIRESFEGILKFPPLDSTADDSIRLTRDHKYCHDSFLQMIRIINSYPEFKKILIAQKGDFLATANEIKDLDLLRVSKQLIPENDWLKVEKLSDTKSQAAFVRKYLKNQELQVAQIEEFYFIDAGLTSIPPELIKYCPNLMGLDLSNNQIKKIPEELKFLTKLRGLNLSSNQIKEIPEAIEFLTELTSLNLSNNPIKEIPVAIKFPTKLQWLYLSNNQIKEIPAAIEFLTKLQWLNLSNNQIKKIPEAIKFLTELQCLNLSNNLIKEIPVAITSFTKLHLLNLSNNQIKEIPETIKFLIKLFNIKLSNNPCDLKKNPIKE
jgi:hypothetical protein